jgi:CBS domain-containing protein
MTPGRVTLDDPAFSVMTDLREVSVATTTAEETIAAAHAQMIKRGVRLLFALDRDGGIAGVLTATDLLGEKPVRFMQERGASHAEIQVSDIMTPAAMLEALPIMEVAQMRVGHIVATLKAVGRKHLMVAEEGGRRVRGLFSASGTPARRRSGARRAKARRSRGTTIASTGRNRSCRPRSGKPRARST